MIRALFGVSLVLMLVGALSAAVTLAADGEIQQWVAVVSIAGATLFAVAVALVLRTIMWGMSKVSRKQSQQQSAVTGLSTAVRALNTEQATRDDVILAEVLKLKKRTMELERSQADQLARLGRVNKRQKEEKNRSEALRARLERVRDAQKVQAKAAAADAKRLEKRQSSAEESILKHIDVTHIERIRPPLLEMEREQAAGYRQLESLVSLLTSLDLRAPLPHMRRTWAIDPDSAAFLIRTVFERSPRTVVELGSGVSTVLVARALETLGSGRVRSLEQSAEFLGQTLDMLRAEGVADRVDLVEADITDVTIDDVVWKWYSPTALEGLESVDLLIVDGPPSRTGNQARYPAVPMLSSVLADGALVFLDDADREDEQSVVQRWLDEFPLVALDVPKLEKGAALLEWRS